MKVEEHLIGTDKFPDLAFCFHVTEGEKPNSTPKDRVSPYFTTKKEVENFGIENSLPKNARIWKWETA